MSAGANPSLSIAIDRLLTAGSHNFAIWVTQSSFPGGYVHAGGEWPVSLSQKWAAWQEMFSLQQEVYFPRSLSGIDSALPDVKFDFANPNETYSGRLMQELGISLWHWLFNGSIRQALAQSLGLAAGRKRPLRLQLEIRDPDLVALPWEIMQSAAGTQALSLDPQVLFSRTTSNVASLAERQACTDLNILLVLGESKSTGEASPTTLPVMSGFNLDDPTALKLEQEAKMIAKAIEESGSVSDDNAFLGQVRAEVTTLVRPTPSQLVESLDTCDYNVFLYAGHGMPDADGGQLFLHPEGGTINGTELAQVLVRNQIALALFNACWGAQPQQNKNLTLERSSLAEVLLHHGVPAVLAMRGAIADEEALCFIRAFTKALTQRMPIDRAMQVARQQLLTIYRFNQPVWTLPILYMHPEFDGSLVSAIEDITLLPDFSRQQGTDPFPPACLRSLDSPQDRWQIYGGMMRVGRRQDNDLAIPEKWVSQRHAEIICREQDGRVYRYFLRDFSRFGTLISSSDDWYRVHHAEVPLRSGMRLKFGSVYGQPYEFVVDTIPG